MSYAIFSTGGAQFRAEPGVTIKVPLLQAEPGSKGTFDRVLLASDGKHVQAGETAVEGAKEAHGGQRPPEHNEAHSQRLRAPNPHRSPNPAPEPLPRDDNHRGKPHGPS